MSNIDKQALIAKIKKQTESFDTVVLKEDEANALLDELEAVEKKAVEMPTFDGYVPHVARELQAAFRIACDNAGINIAAAGKGE